MNVLISGAGIAGPTLAYWLLRYGIQPTIVERSPKLRTGGYIIDFWGAGYDVAQRMGLIPEIQRKGYRVREVRVVNRHGHRVAGFASDAVVNATRGRYVSLARGDLAAIIFHSIEGRAETIFDDAVTGVEETPTNIRVTFEHSGARRFDIVIGADGLHSRIRDLTFGPACTFEKYLGYKVAAFSIDGYEPRDSLVYVMYTEVGQQVTRFAMRDNRTLFLFTFTDPLNSAIPSDSESQKAVLRSRFSKTGWETQRVLGALDGASEFYFDRVSQIRMPSPDLWTRGRVTLVGDAASCVSLLAGEGSGLAMVAAYLLARELEQADGNYAAAFARYQQKFEPFVRGKQKAAIRFAEAFAPRSRGTLFLRNLMFNLMSVGWGAKLVLGKGLSDDIELPD